jgi:hypothetical protein
MAFSSRSCNSPLSLASITLGVQVTLAATALLAQEGPEPKIPAVTGPAREKPPDASAIQMIDAFENMTASSPIHEDLLRKNIEHCAEVTRRFVDDIQHEGSLVGGRAREIRNVLECTFLKPAVVEETLRLRSAELLCTSLADVYEVLLPKLVAMQHAGGVDAAIAQEELGLHYQRLLRVACTSTSTAKPHIIRVLLNYYALPAVLPMHKVFRDISGLLEQEPGLQSEIALANFESIGQSFGEHLSHVIAAHKPAQATELLSIHRHLSKAITYALHQGTISEAEYARLDSEITQRYITPLVPHLFSIWLAADKTPTSLFAGTPWSLLNSNPLSNEAACERADSTTQYIIDLLSAWQGDRAVLGNLYFEAIDRYRKEHGPCKELGYASVGVLPLMAPEPTRKEFIIEALRAALVDDRYNELLGRTEDRPSQVGRVLALCLLSDYLFFATEANTSYNAVAASPLITWLACNQAPLGNYSAVLTPAQSMFIELLRVARGGELALSVEWFSQYDARSRTCITDRAQQALTWLMYEVYGCKSLEGSLDSAASSTTPILSIPWEWGPSVARLPGAGRGAAWRESEREFFSLADLVFEMWVDLPPTGSSEFAISGRINDALRILRARGSYNDRRYPDRECKALKTVRELYSMPTGDGPAPSNSYFTTLRHTVVDLQRGAHGKSSQASSRKDIENRALTYVETLQRLCIVEFLQQEIRFSRATDRAMRGPITRELHEACKQFGFLKRDPRIARILAEKTVSLISSQADMYAEELRAELSALLSEMQILPAQR